MTELPPLLRDQRKVDADHLKLLAVFHFVLAGLSIVGLGFLFLHWSLMHAIMELPQKTPTQGPPPAEFFAIFKWFYVIMGTITVLYGAANLVSGLFIRRRKGRVLSLVLAGFNCFAFPFGTTLGVFTIIILIRDSVVELYDANAQ